MYIIADDEVVRESGKSFDSICRLDTFSSAQAAIDAMGSDPADIVLLDLDLAGTDAVAAVRGMKELLPDVLVIAGRNDVASVVSAIEAGAYDYLIKSPSSPPCWS